MCVHMHWCPADSEACCSCAGPCRRAGVNGESLVFLLSDTQVVSESFLEDINNVLNSGEVRRTGETLRHMLSCHSCVRLAVAWM